MANEERAKGTQLPLAPKRKWGYDVEQVDEFLQRAHQLYDAPQPQLKQEDIQNVLFTLVRGGYDIDAVDRALLRLEQAAVDKQTSYEIADEGRVAWRTKTIQLAQTLMPRATAEDSHRFASGRGKDPSYDRKQVDSFVVNIMTRICDELSIDYDQAVESSNFDSDEDFVPRYVSTILFTQRKGAKGYDEGQVDMYLNRVAQVVSRIVAFGRLEGVTVKDAMRTGGNNPAGQGEPYAQKADYEGLASLEESLFAGQDQDQAQNQYQGQGQSNVVEGRGSKDDGQTNEAGADQENAKLNPYEGVMPVSFAPTGVSQRFPQEKGNPQKAALSENSTNFDAQESSVDSGAQDNLHDSLNQGEDNNENNQNNDYKLPDLLFPVASDNQEASGQEVSGQGGSSQEASSQEASTQENSSQENSGQAESEN